MRVPARLWMLGGAVPGSAAALAIAQIENPRPGGDSSSCSAIAGLLLDGWPRSFTLAAAPDPSALESPAPRSRAWGCPSPATKPSRCIARSGTACRSSTATAATRRRNIRRCATCSSARDPRDPRTAGLARTHSRSSSSTALDADGSWRRYAEAAGATRSMADRTGRGTSCASRRCHRRSSRPACRCRLRAWTPT